MVAALTGSDETLENAYLMRLAGRFSRRIRGYAKAHCIPVIDCSAGQRKHDLAEEYLAKTTVTQGLFLVLVGRAQAPVWDVSAKHHIERKKPHWARWVALPRLPRPAITGTGTPDTAPADLTTTGTAPTDPNTTDLTTMDLATMALATTDAAGRVNNPIRGGGIYRSLFSDTWRRSSPRSCAAI